MSKQKYSAKEKHLMDVQAVLRKEAQDCRVELRILKEAYAEQSRLLSEATERIAEQERSIAEFTKLSSLSAEELELVLDRYRREKAVEIGLAKFSSIMNLPYVLKY